MKHSQRRTVYLVPYVPAWNASFAMSVLLYCTTIPQFWCFLVFFGGSCQVLAASGVDAKTLGVSIIVRNLEPVGASLTGRHRSQAASWHPQG